MRLLFFQQRCDKNHGEDQVQNLETNLETTCFQKTIPKESKAFETRLTSQVSSIRCI